jgi:hypothetical protein
MNTAQQFIRSPTRGSSPQRPGPETQFVLFRDWPLKGDVVGRCPTGSARSLGARPRYPEHRPVRYGTEQP